jgi:hypothetical protein
MLQAFHNLLIAWSDDGGATWTPQLAYDAGIGHDTPTPFVAFTLDNQGNPYFSFTAPPRARIPSPGTRARIRRPVTGTCTPASP